MSSHALHLAPKIPSYSRRKPELTPCYQVIQKHLATFIEERKVEGRPLPEYVLKEFEAFQKCGIPAYGFLRLKCTSCEKEKFVAFSCKKRGFCPSCCAKRMSEAAEHLTENILPMRPYRQFVLSFPIPLRYWLQINRKLFAKIHGLVIKEIHQFYIEQARFKGVKKPVPGSVSFTQRWGSALNLNPHLHILCLDGAYDLHQEKPRFTVAEDITDEQTAKLVTTISQKVMGHLQKIGLLDREGEVVENPSRDDIFEECESIREATMSSVAQKIAFGPNAGQYVTKIGSGFGYGEEVPLAKGKRCFSINGFSLHANTSPRIHQRKQLAKLIEYISRGPLSNEKLEITEAGNVKLQLKTRFADGTTHILFTPSEFIEKLCALIPPPKLHLVKWAGVFAPNHPLRAQVILKPQNKKGMEFSSGDEQIQEAPLVKNMKWAKHLARVFKIDVSKCEHCGGEMVAICAVMKKESIIRYLKSQGVDYEPPPRAPPNVSVAEFEFESDSYSEDCPEIILN